jgi:hypothetical protein
MRSGSLVQAATECMSRSTDEPRPRAKESAKGRRKRSRM